MSRSDALNQYAAVNQSGIQEATPHNLILLLYDGALVSIRIAIQQMKEGDVAGKGEAISKALAIIDDGLRASLNRDKGGEIASNLDALYEYMCDRLLQANLRNEVEPLEEVLRLLGEIREAWEQIGTSAKPAAADVPPEHTTGGQSYGAA